MDRWIREYRDNHPLAAQWARGSRKVCHDEQTQGRVFRMAEQLRVTFDWPNVGPLFSLLRTLDEAIDMETAPNRRPTPGRAATAGAVGYKQLFDKLPPLNDHGWPLGFNQVEEEEVGLAALGLQRERFDPIVIDGIDPAAYLWALFEMHQRELACTEVVRLHQHPVHEPRCLAVIPSVSPTPAETSRSRAEVAAG